MSSSESEEYEEDIPKPFKYSHTLRRDIKWLQENAKKPGVIERESGLQYRVLRKAETKEGNPRPGPDTICVVHYFGMLTYGVEFASTYKGKGEPKIVKPSDCKPGLREALQLMREGDKFQVFVPADLGYGEDGGGNIPGGSVLIYDIELLGVDHEGGKSDAELASEQRSKIAFRAFQAFLVIVIWLLLTSGALSLYRRFFRGHVTYPGPPLDHMSGEL